MSIVISKPQVEIDAAIRNLLQVQEEKLTIVHCRFKVEGGTMYRIWPQTFLIEDGGRRRKLIKAFNISLMPHWTIYFNDLGTVQFTLIFEGLSGNCNNFTLLEDIPEPGGFFTEIILRNKSDVYDVEVCTE